MRTGFSSLVGLILPTAFGLTACGLAACGTYPIMDGFHTSLPRENSRAVVWGGDVSAAEEARRWLKHHGVIILEEIFSERASAPIHTREDERQLLEFGKRVGADTIVFVDVSMEPHRSWTFGLSGTVYRTGVAVRGLSVETGEVIFEGIARHLRPDRVENGVAALTCYALASAWDRKQHSLCETSIKTK